MIIPKDPELREIFYDELRTKCFTSVPERVPEYERLKNYFLFGSEDGTPVDYNKINSHIDLLSAFLFASETTKFSVSLGASVSRVEYKKTNAVSQAVLDEWLRSGIDSVFSQAVAWSCVYNSTFIKLVWSNGIHAYLVEPHNLGVLREDLPGTDRQEAVAFRYQITQGDLNWRLQNHPDRDKIMERVSINTRKSDSEPSGVQRIILSSSSPNMVGSIDGLPAGTRYEPKVDEEMVEMTELWVWDDENEDYRTVTVADPGVIIYERKNIFLSGELPFIQVCPNPLYNYYWGASEVAKLTLLQDWRTSRMRQIRKLLDKAVDPPKAINGTFGILDEKNFALNQPGGLLSFADPMAKIEEFKPQVPQDVFVELDRIDQMFNEASGLSATMQGMGERGVRTRGQVSELSRLGSTRAKKRALVIEDSLEKMATLCLKLIQKHDARKLLDDDGQPFIAEQFTHDYVMKVDAHSSSPIFVEDQRDLAFALFEHEAIGKDTLLEMASPPSVHLLKQRLKDMEERATAQPRTDTAEK